MSATSKQSLQQLDVRERRAEVLGYIDEKVGRTAQEVERLMAKAGRGIVAVSAHKRISELHTAGLVSSVGRTKCPVTGRMVETWVRNPEKSEEQAAKQQALRDLRTTVVKDEDLKPLMKVLDGLIVVAERSGLVGVELNTLVRARQYRAAIKAKKGW